MSIVSRQSITRWLNQVILPYPSRDQALSQLEATLDLYPTLSPKTDSFTFDDGRTALLVSLIGTIAVDYRGSRYNIPIAIWLPFEFPKGPPIVYVTPTNEMIIKTSTHVDPSGKCLGGYLDSWQSKPEACCLKDLIESLQDLFSRQSPLYSKPKAPAPAYTSQPSPIPSTSRFNPTSSQQPPRPPLPPQLARSTSSSSSASRQSLPTRPQPPTRPPLPPPLYSTSSTSSKPAPVQAPQHSHLVVNPRSLHSPPPPHILPASGSHSRIVQSSPNVIQAGIGLDSHQPSSVALEYRRSISPTGRTPISPFLQLSTSKATPIEQSMESLQIQGPSLPSIKTPNFLDEPLDEPSTNTGSNNRSPGNLPAPRPPRPPNPELLSLRQSVYFKLQSELERLTSNLNLEKQQLEILETDLLKGEPAIQDEIARLEAVRDVCTNVGDRYRELIDQLNARIVELTHQRKIVDVDELVCSTTVLYNQLWELVINDKVIDDLIYNLARALNNNLDGSKIDLEKFLKRVRILGHEQFLNRLMINQICQQLGFSLSSSTASSAP